MVEANRSWQFLVVAVIAHLHLVQKWHGAARDCDHGKYEILLSLVFGFERSIGGMACPFIRPFLEQGSRECLQKLKLTVPFIFTISSLAPQYAHHGPKSTLCFSHHPLCLFYNLLYCIILYLMQ